MSTMRWVVENIEIRKWPLPSSGLQDKHRKLLSIIVKCGTIERDIKSIIENSLRGLEKAYKKHLRTFSLKAALGFLSSNHQPGIDTEISSSYAIHLHAYMWHLQCSRNIKMYFTSTSMLFDKAGNIYNEIRTWTTFQMALTF